MVDASEPVVPTEVSEQDLKTEQANDSSVEVATAEQDGQANEANEDQESSQVHPVEIRIIRPTNAKTLPPRQDSGSFQSLTLLPQSHETIQELKLAVNEYVGGYWLGPYSLRIPVSQREDAMTTESAAKAPGKEGLAEVKPGDKLSDWLEVGHVFDSYPPGRERVLEVHREPYSEFSARQSVLRLVELLSTTGPESSGMASIGLSAGATIFESVRDGTATAPAFREVEVSLPGKKSKGKKEIVKVKQEGKHAFADWSGDWPQTDLQAIPISPVTPEVLPCLKNIQLAAFNPPPAHLKQVGHQLYLQVTLLEGDVLILVCTTRGWFVSRSTTSSFDAAPRTQLQSGAQANLTHSLIDLLHSLSPMFTERLNRLPPLSVTPPVYEPISTVPIPQAEPAYPFLATPPKPDVESDLIKTQLAFLHTGAVTADGLDGARDWNEEIQGIRELPKKTMQERVLREKIAQKTFAEFTAASVRGVMAVARGDIPPLNPTEDPRAHMYLISNIFITKAVDSIDAYAHLGGDAAAHVSHGKDAAGVKLLNKLDIDGVSLLGHTVVDWVGERWICQSMLPGIFSRRAEEPIEDTDAQSVADGQPPNGEASDKKDDWVKVDGSASKSSETDDGQVRADDSVAQPEEPAENPLIVYGYDSEIPGSIHWDATTHKLMAKVAASTRLAPHKVASRDGKEYDFYASAEVKALCGNDGRRYLLDLPRLSPVDVEWLERDVDGKLIESEVEGPAYPHRLVLLRPELIETFWEDSLKRWARETATSKAKESKATEIPVEASDASAKDNAAEEGTVPDQETKPDVQEPSVEALDASSLADFNLTFNPDAFTDQPVPKGSTETDKPYLPSTVTDTSDPSIKAVRDASLFLRQVAVPAMVLDALAGNLSGVMDGISLSKAMHGRGINIRYLGYLLSTIDSFSKSTAPQKPQMGVLSYLRALITQEMFVRATKHVVRSLLVGLVPEHAQCALSHILNCLLGAALNPSPQAIYTPLNLDGESSAPAYTQLTPESLRSAIVEQIQSRFRWTLAESYFDQEIRKPQLVRELASRIGFQLLQRAYTFDATSREQANGHVEESNGHAGSSPTAPSKKDKKSKSKETGSASKARQTTFEPSDILTLLPIIKSTAPPCAVAAEIFDAGRATLNRGNLDLGLGFMLEAVQLYENIHSVLHPEVAAAYNEYASTIHQLARLKIQQLANENADPEQPLDLDLALALRLQRQGVIIAERTLGVYHSETCAYYFNLAMLEHLEGNTVTSLKYFRHILDMWDIIHGPKHPEINTILSNAGVVLQAMSEHKLSLAVLTTSYDSTVAMFGSNHIQTAQSQHQLTQAHFLAGDIPAALASAKAALPIFENTVGKDHHQTKEVMRNVEILSTVADSVERQKALGEQAKARQLDRLHAAQSRVGGMGRKRLGQTLPSASNPLVSNGAAGSKASGTQPSSKIGTRGHLDVDELVNFIQGGSSATSTGTARSKQSLRGKRRK
ncbi:translational initiation-related protein [Kockovaella imperatae]|uniref:Translational initiation-related protein n=1 Tax=Kockovaella imperatae TaxID=4999 RepID=A0A1Y1UHD3_9TREE|nr:translational initiation-related protein [Kockovaella imperatae]ORX37442.1 translational initiation-related protein [Kockovaella imperatae]